ncbi:crotonase/enoyl-CoA hydratase family protein [Zavarzinia compransoris]|uniref:Crotonase/enoyl-CoA hydratase family protein n=1 Tax=Zavarzinia compransoris TaxID=1264899 RepID=A0A317DWL7_9PROT|nr:crotonase/enoyl-CoA hydratase family protein [Zavarzinia compransoris]PWR19127.1 crotonase/enoyl-CoA hydratase family protein [Zavarzinia compransoris]TDP49139.1 enoyl-CoA hydratase [Zavarzinia compransoris]
MAYQAFDVTVSNHIAHLQLKRPEQFNSMIPAFWSEILTIFDALAADPAVRVAVLSSTGKHFTAGMDLAVFANLAPAVEEEGRKREELRRKILNLQECFSIIERMRFPVLAAIQGGCIGGGVDLVSACDMRFATRDAFFHIAEINIGMTADVGTLQRLPKIVPEGVVREMAFTGRRLGAERAHQVGLVNQLFDSHEAMLDGVMAIAAEIAGHSPLAIAGTKEMLNYSRDHSVADGLNYIATWNSAMLLTVDLPEAIAARSQKRQPAFDNLSPPAAKLI